MVPPDFFAITFSSKHFLLEWSKLCKVFQSLKLFFQVLVQVFFSTFSSGHFLLEWSKLCKIFQSLKLFLSFGLTTFISKFIQIFWHWLKASARVSFWNSGSFPSTPPTFQIFHLLLWLNAWSYNEKYSHCKILLHYVNVCFFKNEIQMWGESWKEQKLLLFGCSLPQFLFLQRVVPEFVFYKMLYKLLSKMTIFKKNQLIPISFFEVHVRKTFLIWFLQSVWTYRKKMLSKDGSKQAGKFVV